MSSKDKRTHSQIDSLIDAMKESTVDEALEMMHKIESHEMQSKWERYRPKAYQRRFHQSQAQVRMFCGGNRAGKTTAGLMEAIWYMKGAHPYRPVLAPNQGWIVCLDNEVLEDVILPKLMEYLPETDYELNRNKGILKLKNKSLAKFKSCDSGAQKFQSAERRWIWFDEEPPYDIWKECLIRVGADFPLDVWITMTPLMGMDWTYDELIQKQVPGRREVFGASLMDNDSLPLEERNRLYEEYKDTPEAAARLFGEYFHRSGLIYRGLREDTHFIDPFEIPKDWPVIRAVDPHDRKSSAAIWMAFAPDGNRYIFQELNDDYEYLLEEFAKRVLEKSFGYRIGRSLTDPSAKKQSGQTGITIQDYLAGCGLPTVDANNSLSYGYEQVRRLISTPSGPKLFVFRTCPKTWQQLTRLVYEEAKTRNDRDPREVQKKKNDDLADCVRYAAAEPFEYSPPESEGLAPYEKIGHTGARDRIIPNRTTAIPIW